MESWAKDKSPSRDSLAPVNEPLTWPNSSLRASSFCSEAQFLMTIWLPASGERSWMRRATTSLPVPDSPVMSTGIRAGATLSMRNWMSRTALELPMNRTPRLSPPAVRRSMAFSRASAARWCAFSTIRSSRSRLNGLRMKS